MSGTSHMRTYLFGSPRANMFLYLDCSCGSWNDILAAALGATCVRETKGSLLIGTACGEMRSEASLSLLADGSGMW